MLKRKNLLTIFILTILFNPTISTLDPMVVEASIATDYASAEKEGQKLKTVYTSFSKTLKTGNLDTINQQFYTFSNHLKATEIKINKVNSKSKRDKLKATYLTPAIQLRDSVIYPISEYRTLKTTKNLLTDMKEEQAVTEYKKLVALKKNTAKRTNGLNKNAIAELNTLDKDLGKKIAKIERKNTIFEKPSNFIDINKPRVKLDKYYFTMIPASKVNKEELAKYTEYAEIASEGLVQEFGYLTDVKGILETANVKIFVQDTPDKNAGIGHWSISMYADNRNEIYLLAESAHKVKCCTSTGSNFDDAYFKNTMMHEMSTLILAGVVKEKSTGWRSIFGTPLWFSQGYEEYIAVKYAADTKKLAIMIEQVIDNNTIQFTKNEIKVVNEYRDGLVLVHFLHEKYGTEQVHKVLLSTEPTFEMALEKDIGNMDRIKADFQEWLGKK